MTSPAVKKILDALRANHDEAVRLRLELEKQLTAPVEAGKRPKGFSPDAARRSLAGEVAMLAFCFAWADSPQGEQFWRAQDRARALSPEGRAILEKWLAE